MLFLIVLFFSGLILIFIIGILIGKIIGLDGYPEFGQPDKKNH